MKLALLVGLAGSSVAAAAPDVANELRALGTRKARELAASPTSTTDGEIAAVGPCTRPTPGQRERASAAIDAWLARTHPAERATLGSEPRFGCVDRAGFVVDVQADLETAQGKHGQWSIVRVSGDAVDELASVHGTALDNFMEWAQETTLATVVLADLDHDGLFDVVALADSREGGSSIHDGTLSLLLSSTKQSRRLGSVNSMVEAARGTTSDLVLAITDHNQPTIYRCVEINATLTRCPDATRARRFIDAVAAADRVAQAGFRDREGLAADLELLGVPAADRERLLADALPTPPVRHALRAIEALVAAGADHTLDERAAELDAVHRELTAALGDAPCPAVVAPRPALDAWLQAHLETSANITRRCTGAAGGYYVAERVTPGGDGSDLVTMLLFASGTRPVVELAWNTAPVPEKANAAMDPDRLPIDPVLYRHGDAIVAVVLDGKTLTAFVDGKRVGVRTGELSHDDFELLTVDRSDGRDTVLHVSDALHEVDGAIAARLGARSRAAAATVTLAGITEATLVQQRTDVAAALTVLGADRALVAQVAGLAAP